MKKPLRNVAASVRQRLLNLARQRREEFQLVLTRYAAERLLYRISTSPHGEQFILKGAMLFTLWGGEPHRATRDLDLLGRGEASVERMEKLFRGICMTSVQDDGLLFETDTIHGSRIREDAPYTAVRVEIEARLGVARIHVQVDIGFGDAVVPRPKKAKFPTLLDLPAPTIKVYPREAVIAEKFHALVTLGMANSRMKDFYDLWSMARRFSFEGPAIVKAFAGTFKNRRTKVSSEEPLALTTDFSDDPVKKTQWFAFVRKGRLVPGPDPHLPEVINVLREFLLPPKEAMFKQVPFDRFWPVGGPWSTPKARASRSTASRP